MKNFLRPLILSCLSLSCLFISCTKDNDDLICSEPMSQTSCGSALLSFEADQFNTLVTDSISVVNVDLQNTCLIVEVAYSGCNQREIDAMANIDYQGLTPFLHIKVRNIDPIEFCQAFFNHTDTFDLCSSKLDLNDGMSVAVEDWSETFILDLDE